MELIFFLTEDVMRLQIQTSWGIDIVPLLNFFKSAIIENGCIWDMKI